MLFLVVALGASADQRVNCHMKQCFSLVTSAQLERIRVSTVLAMAFPLHPMPSCFKLCCSLLLASLCESRGMSCSKSKTSEQATCSDRVRCMSLYGFDCTAVWLAGANFSCISLSSGCPAAQPMMCCCLSVVACCIAGVAATSSVECSALSSAEIAQLSVLLY
ncbi:hypothetical protein COO60DRAFT_342139 [Scenedesmus sp. NREL 46B-D3]|nr:hypothetical protein COO60DRAFT_342139 [Scenedesmus sp. NREL 46B-D3]